MRLLILSLFWLVCMCGIGVAGDEGVYLQKIKPLLQQRCLSCHGALSQKSGLRLDTTAAIRRGGDSGPVVTVDEPAASLLIERVSAADPDQRMPPEGMPLTAEEIQNLRNWIAAGASGPADEVAQADPRAHWAFQKPDRPKVPPLRGDSQPLPANPIDAFVFEQLSTRAMQPLPEADPSTLLRRVTLDLIGVPPTSDDLERFLTDRSPNAFEQVVDRLLADSRYGERWGRHWMDVWRYSDWYGRRSVPDVMNSYPHIWRWRDWIVRSLNSDRGYDQMVLAMLAADEVFPGDDDEVVATGFLVRNWFKWNYESWMKDNVEHTGKAFLGLTLNCCQCHDHKYDPITQREYFQFRAFFEPLELRQDRVAGLPDPGPFKKYVYAQSYGPIAAGLIRVFDEKLDAETFMYAKGDARNRIEGEPPAVPLVPAVLGAENFKVEPIELVPDAFYPGVKPFLRSEELAKANLAVVTATVEVAKVRETADTARQSLADARSEARQPVTAATPPNPESLLAAEVAAIDAEAAVEVAGAKHQVAAARQASLNARIAADDAKHHRIGSPEVLARVASLAERRAAWLATKSDVLAGEQALIVAERAATNDEGAKAGLPNVQKKLDAARAAAEVARKALAATNETYTPLSPVYPPRSTGRRAALARWIASPQNPLTARVAVNHLWMRHFGRGLVETPSNFGLNGKSPTHPELLDWLAVEFIEGGWSMKHLHRLMVTSRVYRSRSQIGAPQHPNLDIDPENKSYWRFSPRRMEAEVVRDSVLACAGTLDDAAGGQELDHGLGLTNRRRSLYFASHGESQMQFLDLFDGPTPAECYERTSSIMPQQALSLANSDLVMQQARVLATALWQQSASESPRRDDVFVRSAFRRILTRDPRENELAESIQFLREQSELLQKEVQAAAVASSKGDAVNASVVPAGDAHERARVDFIHALFNHHDFVSIR